MTEWYVARLPKGVEFTHIKKEKDTQGRVFLIYEQDGEEPCWLSQSMPAIVRAINSIVSRPKRLHCSSAYGILRQESLTHVHKNHHIMVYHRNELEELNEHISLFPGDICITKYVDAWSSRRSQKATRRAQGGFWRTRSRMEIWDSRTHSREPK